MADLLVSAQRVSKYWLGIITESIRLQQALFFVPIAPPVKPSLTYKTSIDDNPHSLPNAYRNEIVATFNPLLRRHFGSLFFHRHGHADLDRRRNAFTRSGASWRRMLVAQPAPPGLGYVWQHIERRLAYVQKGYIDTYSTRPQPPSPSEVGLRFGVLYDLVQYHAGHHASHNNFQLWCRVVWGRPYDALDDPHVIAIMELMRETCVVVEFLYENGRHFPAQPADVEAFDHAFRSEDFQIPAVDAVEVFRNVM
ncbi:hypothetical protein BDW62DRAFT_200935 [Aspergillus aurantiobrunneus]